MALTATEQSQIVVALGWPGATLFATSTTYNQTVANRLVQIDTDTETAARDYLAQITALRLKYTDSTNRMLVRKVGDIELNSGEHENLGREYRRLLRELSTCLDIPLLAKGGRNIGVSW